MKLKIPAVFLPIILCMALVLISHVPVYAIAFTWGGAPISGEAGEENPDFFPAGSAEFLISGSTLTLILAYTGSSEPISGNAQILTGLIWDMEGFSGTLTEFSAVLTNESHFVLGTSDNNITDKWGYDGNINLAPFGQYGVSTVGTLGGVAEEYFGNNVNGVDFGIVPSDDLPSNNGIANQGPLVVNAIEFNFLINSDLTEDMFTNVRPIFGSEGMAPVPEPATMLLFGAGLIGLAGFRRKFKK